jgi:hypothetical protein
LNGFIIFIALIAKNGGLLETRRKTKRFGGVLGAEKKISMKSAPGRNNHETRNNHIMREHEI